MTDWDATVTPGVIYTKFGVKSLQHHKTQLNMLSTLYCTGDVSDKLLGGDLLDIAASGNWTGDW